MRTVNATRVRAATFSVALASLVAGCLPTGDDTGSGRAFPLLLGPTRYALTVDVQGKGSVEPAGGEFDEGDTAKLTAKPETGWRFAEWQGDVPAENLQADPLLLVMDGDRSVTAVFVQQFSLTIETDGAGTVDIDTDQDPAPKDDLFDADAQVTLTAKPADGWAFRQWRGDLSLADPEDNPLTLTMDHPRKVTAVFVRQFTLYVETRGQGLVQIDGAEGVAKTEEKLDEGASVLLAAVPAEGWLFMGWEGAASGSTPTVAVTMSADVRVTAVFVALAGHRAITVDGIAGQMTIAVQGSTIRGVQRTYILADDIEGTVFGNKVNMTCRSPGFKDSYVTATILPDGSWVGTINGSGYVNNTFTASPVDLAGFDDPAAGLRTTQLKGSSGLLCAVIKDGIVRGTWRLAFSLGGDVEGTIANGQINLTATVPGCAEPTKVVAAVQPDGTWVGTVDGSGFNNAPFQAAPPYFP